jgi:hypothetical protein
MKKRKKWQIYQTSKDTENGKYRRVKVTIILCIFIFINKSFKLNVMPFTDQRLEYHYANSLNETKLSVSEQMKCVPVPDEIKPIM